MMDISAPENKKVLNIVHVSRRDEIGKWENSTLPLFYGEIALGYNNGILVELRAGEKFTGSGSGAGDGRGTNPAWSGLKTFIPAFKNSEKDETQDTQLFGLKNGIPAILPHSSGGTSDHITVSINDSNEITADFNNGVIIDELGSGTGEDTIPTSEAVMDYVQSQISSATPNIEAGDGINITTNDNTKTVEVKLDETNSTITDNAGSGLVTSSDGLRIDDSITWVWQCGGADASDL